MEKQRNCCEELKIRNRALIRRMIAVVLAVAVVLGAIFTQQLNFDQGGKAFAADSILVTEDEWNTKYKDNPNYEGVKIHQYRQATRNKEYKQSGYDTQNGYTKYDSKSTTTTSGYLFGTPVATTTLYNSTSKVVKSAVEKGHYYFAYAVAAPIKTGDWTFYVDSSRANVINHMKRNYSDPKVWSEARLRYFWYISPTKLAVETGGNLKNWTKNKLNKSIPYCDNSNVSVKTTSKTGNHYYDLKIKYYSQCYKIKTVTTTNYFWKWSNWSAWSDWKTGTHPDIQEDESNRYEDRDMYLVEKKGFDMNRDIYGFTNSSENFNANYNIEDEYFEDLLEAANSDTQKSELVNKRDSEWQGSCYGMAVSVALNKSQHINASVFDELSEGQIIKMRSPREHSGTENLINYYHLTQFLGVDDDLCWINNDTQNAEKVRRMFENIEDVLSRNQTVPFGFYGDTNELEWFGHELLLYDCVKKANETEYLAYDCNYGSEKVTVTVSNDYKTCKVKTPDGVLMPRIIEPTTDLSKLENIKIATDTEWDSFDEERTKISADATSFKITNAEGEKLEFDGGDVNGDMKIYDMDYVFSDAKDGDEVPRIQIWVDNSAHFSYQAVNGEQDFAITNSKIYEAVEAQNADKIVLSGTTGEKGIIVQGKKGQTYNYKAALHMNTSHTNLIKLEGSTEKKLEVKQSHDTLEATGVSGKTKVTSYAGYKKIKTSVVDAKNNKITVDDSKNTQTNGDMGKIKKVNIVIKGKNRKMQLSWGKSRNATDYRVMYRDAKSAEWDFAWTGGMTKHTIGKLKNKGLYEVKVIPYRYDQNTKVWSKGNGSAVKRNYIGKVKKLKAKPIGSKRIKVMWKKFAGASGYQVDCYAGKNLQKAKYVKATKKSLIIGNLKKGKKYSFKVRPYKTYKGKKYFGEYAVKKIKQ